MSVAPPSLSTPALLPRPHSRHRPPAPPTPTIAGLVYDGSEARAVRIDSSADNAIAAGDGRVVSNDCIEGQRRSAKRSAS